MTVLLREPLGDGVIVAVDPGKAVNRVWVTDRGGLVGEPLSLPTSRDGIEVLERLVGEREAVFAIEATGSLHRAWATELERRRPGSLRLFAPSETQAARAQLGTRRFKTDDRDCAALVWLARQGAGRPAACSGVEAMKAAVAHRRQLILTLTPLRQRLHDQLNALAPGLSAPADHGRALPLDRDCPSFCVWGRGDLLMVVVVSRGSGLRSGSSARLVARSKCGCVASGRRP